MAAAAALVVALACVFSLVFSAQAEAPYRFFDWEVTYGDINPLGGVPQQVHIVLSQAGYAVFICAASEVNCDVFDFRSVGYSDQRTVSGT